MKRGNILGWLFLWVAIVAGLPARADSTWVYAVQISAVVQDSPASITLSWVQDMYGANSYAVYRKAKEDTSWGSPVASLSGAITNYTDTNVEVGQTYEYQIVKDATLGYIGYGYIFSGIEAPLTDERGTLVLVVATNSAYAMDAELAQLENDFIGDGWQLIRHDVSSNDTPQEVRSLITNDYWADPSQVNAVFLFGHVPILESGYSDYDGHYTRSMPADTYYGEMNDDWPIPANPTNGPNFIPSDVVLEVGRVDLYDMPGQGSAIPFPSEQELLRNYLIKDHNWRTHQIPVQRNALMGDRRGSVDGPQAIAASGYRNFTPFVGASNIIQANIQDDAPIPQRWISMMDTGDYLWSFGDGGGELNGCTYLGTNGEYNEVLTPDIVNGDARAVFVMLFGSYMGNWDGTDDLLRSALATPTMGLACFMTGEPHWFVDHMGLGETIGYDTRLSMNNNLLYQNASNAMMRAVYVNLMGDPTLRQDPITPPSGLTTSIATNGVNLNWNAGLDPVLGYNIYISESQTGPFILLNDSPVTATSYTDSESPGAYYYMVRGVRLEMTPSGTYYNASEGIFAGATVSPPPAPPIRLTIAPQNGGIGITWDSVSNSIYHVLTSPSMIGQNWTDISGPLIATGATTTWTVPITSSNSQSFYEIVSP